MEEINVNIVKGIGGADCDVVVPLDATVGDVIVGLINEGFLDADTTSMITVLQDLCGSKYVDRNVSVGKYGWQSGMTLIACLEKPISKEEMECSNITLTFVNDLTTNSIVKKLPKMITVENILSLLVKDGFLSNNSKYSHWSCLCNDKILPYPCKLEYLNLKSGDLVRFHYTEIEEINVKIVKGIGEADCDIDVPMDATVGDVIVGLINEGFLDEDTTSATTVLYNMDADGGISCGAKYNDRSKTVSAYGWQNGQTLLAVYTGVAKPVIYLYPKETSNIKVSIKNSALISVSYPLYPQKGWDVIAHPRGTITDIEGKNEYSYLFWEVTGKKYYEITQGYVVHRDDLIDFLKEKLASYGLLPKEYNEFIVYWYPILSANEYNAISFFCNEYEKDFELYIEPKPDEILRVFMVYKKATKETVLLPPSEPLPLRRNGFTVVEWGGQLDACMH